MPRGIRNPNADIRTIRHSLHRIVDTLVSLLENAQSGVSHSSPVARARTGSAVRKRQAPRPRARLSRARHAALKLQGEYIGRLRGLKPVEKARVKALRAKKGFPAAIRLAARLAS